MQAYSDPERETDPYAIPDIEVWHTDDYPECVDEDGDPLVEGWYWWTCSLGCLPDGEPTGPFATEAEALADAQDWD